MALDSGQMIITERDCAGQAGLVRDQLRQLNAAVEEADGPASMAKAKDAALSLACELETYQLMCERCRT